MGQPIRPSQFILTYGVGSIVEAPKGPRLIPTFEKWDLFRRVFSGSGATITSFRIVEPNATAQLNGGEIFEIPSSPSSFPALHFNPYRTALRGFTVAPYACN